MFQFMAFASYSCSSIECIAAENKIFFYYANITNGNVTCMNAGLESRCYSVFFHIVIMFSLKDINCLAYEFQTPGFVLRRICPTDHHFVANILINMSPVTDYRIGYICKKIMQHIKILFMTDLFCNSCGFVYIKKKKYPVFFSWFIITTSY